MPCRNVLVGDIVAVKEGDAIRWVQRLAWELGRAWTSRPEAAITGAIRVCVPGDGLSGRNKKCLSTDYGGQEAARDGNLAPQIELLDRKAIRA